MKRNLLDEIDDVVSRAKILQKLGINICAQIDPQYTPAITTPVKKVVSVTTKPPVTLVTTTKQLSPMSKVVLGILSQDTKLKASEVLTIIRTKELASEVSTKDLPQLISTALTELKQAGKVTRSDDLKYTLV